MVITESKLRVVKTPLLFIDHSKVRAVTFTMSAFGHYRVKAVAEHWKEVSNEIDQDVHALAIK